MTGFNITNLTTPKTNQDSLLNMNGNEECKIIDKRS